MRYTRERLLGRARVARTGTAQNPYQELVEGAETRHASKQGLFLYNEEGFADSPIVMLKVGIRLVYKAEAVNEQGGVL